mgnify:CR=1 FL=1
MVRNVYTTLFLLLVILPQAIFAGTLKGKVTDSKGEPLPFATIYIKGTTIGTAANANADYSLVLQPGTYKVLCQYMGFEQTSYNVIIKGNEEQVHNFSLQEQSLKMENVVVKANAEDPAYAIIRKAIKRRKFHQEQVRAFQTSIYMKTVARNTSIPDKILGIKIPEDELEAEGGGGSDSTKLGVIILSEQEADYYTQGKKERTVIRAVRQSGNPDGLGLPRPLPVVSFYDNNVNPLDDFSERGFISPISDGALNSYRYRYEGEFIQDGYTINKITVIPKRAYDPLFSGTIYIVDKDWAIHSLDLTLTNKNGIQLLDTLKVEQTYLPLKKDTWVIKSQVQYFQLKLFGFDVNGNFIAIYDDQKVNEPIPDSIFADKVISSYLQDANDKDTAHWSGVRVLPLEEDEVQDYHKRDSIYARESSPEYRDSMRRLRNKFSVGDIITGGYYHATKENKSVISTNSLLDGLVTYNTIEGIAVTPKVWYEHEIDTGRTLSAVLAMRYGFGNTHLNAMGRVNYLHKDRSWLSRYWEVGAEGGKYVHQYNPKSMVTQLYNTIAVLAYGKNILKLYESYRAAGYLNRNFGNGFMFGLKAGFEQRLPLQNTTFYTWANNDPEKWTDNVPPPLAGNVWEQHNAVLAKAYVSYRPGTKYIQYPKFKSPVRSRWPLFYATYEKGIPGLLNSKADFDKWRFGLNDYVNMKLLGSIEYNIATGGFLNTNYVSLPDMMHIADNQLAVAAPYLQGFQLAPFYLFSNAAKLYGEAHVEWNLNGFLTNKIPLLKNAGWNLVAGNNTLYLNQSNYYTEAFVGIDNLGYKLLRFRLDVVRGWDHTGQVRTGLRFGFDGGLLAGLAGISIGDDKEKFNW